MNTMKIHKVFATTENGREQISPKIIKTEKGELTAVRIQFKSSLPLNKFSGIELLLNPRGINEFTAIHRHSEYWCMPSFCQGADEIPQNTVSFVARRLPASCLR